MAGGDALAGHAGLDVQGMAFLRSIEERMGALRAAAEGVEAAKRTIHEQHAALVKQREEAMAQQGEAQRLLAEVRQAQDELDQRVLEAERRGQALEAEVRREKGEIEALRLELVKQSEVLASKGEALGQQQRELEASQTELAKVAEALSQRESQLKQMASDLDLREVSVRQQTEVLQQQRLEVEEMIRQSQIQSQPQQGAEVAKLQRKLATMQEIIDHAGEDARLAEARFEQLQQAMNQQQQRFAELEAAGSSHKRQASEMALQIEQLRGELAASGQQVAAFQQRASEAEGQAAELRGRLQQAIAALQAAARDDREAQQATAAKADSAEITRLEKSITTLEAELQQQQTAMHETASRLLKSEELLVQKESELIRLRTELASSAQNAASDILHGGAERSGEVQTFNVVRRARLRKLRLLMRGEYEKLVLAKDAIVRQRQMLEEQSARALVYGRATEPTFDGSSMNSGGEPVMPAMGTRGKAATAASMVVLVALVSMTVIGLLTYAIGSTLAPSMYAARVVLAADSQGKAMTPEQMRKFNQGHATLAGDVQVIALAADRFAQRGMKDWADAGALAEKLGQQLSVMTEVPGQVTLELRAQGRQQTLRAMETFNSSLVAVANSLGASRGDGAMTVVKQPPIVSEDAVGGPEQTVMMMSAGLGVLAAWAGGIGAFFGIRRGLDRSIKQAMSKPKAKPVSNDYDMFSKKAA